VAAADVTEVKSPKPLDELIPRCIGGREKDDLTDGSFTVDFESKKVPVPMEPEAMTEETTGVAICGAGEVGPENREDFGGAFDTVVARGAKVSLPKASSNAARLGCGCVD